MKYTILGFQQDKANNLKLNMNDLLLMRVIKDMYSSAGMEFIVDEGDKYIWVKQDYLHEQIPIIGSKRTMLRIIDNLVELELLDKKVKHKKGKVKGTFFYIKPTTKMDNLQDYDPYDRLSKGGRQIVKRGMTKCHNKDTSITDTSITDNKDSPAKAEPPIPYKKIIGYLNDKADRKFSHVAKSNKDLIKARWNGLKKLDSKANDNELYQAFVTVIDNKVADANDPNHFFKEEYLQPSTLFRESNFDKYLNQPSRQKQRENRAPKTNWDELETLVYGEGD